MQATERDRLRFELRSDGTQNQCLNLAYNPQSKELIEASLSVAPINRLLMNGKMSTALPCKGARSHRQSFVSSGPQLLK